MKDFLLIKNLVGEDLQQEELKNVDCYVHDKFGLFIEPADMLKEEIFNHPGRKFLQAWKENGIDNLLRVFRMKDGVATWWTMEKNFESKEYIKL